MQGAPLHMLLHHKRKAAMLCDALSWLTCVLAAYIAADARALVGPLDQPQIFCDRAAGLAPCIAPKALTGIQVELGQGLGSAAACALFVLWQPVCNLHAKQPWDRCRDSQYMALRCKQAP